MDVAWTVNAYLDAGVPAGKILLGIPLYAYGWKVDSPNAVSQQGQFVPGTPLATSTQSFAYIKRRLSR